jgi:hypothetical protein
MGAVKNAIQRDGLDPDEIDLDPEKALTCQLPPPQQSPDPSLNIDPAFDKYFKMLNVVRQQFTRMLIYFSNLEYMSLILLCVK